MSKCRELEVKYAHLWEKGWKPEIMHGEGWAAWTENILIVADILNQGGIQVRIRQIKEKLGGYRVYVHVLNQDALDEKQMGYVQALHNIINDFEKLIPCVCDVCSKWGSMRRIGHLLATRCDKHSTKSEYV